MSRRAERRTERKAIVVDDDPGVLEYVEVVLRWSGWRVLRATHGRAAVTLAAEHPDIALLIADVNVPGCGGRDLATRIGLACPNAAVLYISGFPEDTVAAEGIQVRAPTYLSKPFTAAELRDAITTAVEPPAAGLD